MLAWLVWNPDRVLFTLPYVNHPIMIYGGCFVVGFILAYFILAYMFKKTLQQNPRSSSNPLSFSEVGYLLSDRIVWYVLLGTLLGARLGHIFFYDWPHFQNHPENILKIWQGGLASHGGVLGVLLAMIIYSRRVLKDFPEITFLKLIDIMVIPAGLVATFIRIGNFFNQEIIGPVTTLPWAVVFGDPMDGEAWVPRHPTQLYEALAYFSIFIALSSIWLAKAPKLKPGTLSGLFFSLLFSARFLIEFVKLPQSTVIDETFLQMGQYLSLPFILLGIALLYFPRFSSPISPKHLR